MKTHVKICGVRRPEDIEAAAKAGAAYVGLVFYPPSPRAVGLAEAAKLAADAPAGLCKVGLFVNPQDDLLSETLSAVALDMVQLHGSESPSRVAQIRENIGLPVMKAVAIATEQDVAKIAQYEAVADQILCDAKPRPQDVLPGGNGASFEWALVHGRKWRKPWMLAGGLRCENVRQAIVASGAAQVDVSSGVESAPGVKDPQRIEAFIAAAQGEKEV